MTAHVRIPTEVPTRGQAPGLAVQVGLVAALAVYVHLACWAVVPPDMKLFLFPWYQHIVEQGPVAAFAAPFSNYTPPYLYLLAAGSLADPLVEPLHVIKLLSVAGTAFLAVAVADLLRALGADPRRAVFVLALPTAVLNAALLGQCDALWAGACVLAVAAMIRGRTVAALVWCGVAVAFKAQGAFIAPFIIGALIGRRAPLWQWAIPPLVYAALMLPAWLVGWPAADLATVYLRQAAWFETPGNLANPRGMGERIRARRGFRLVRCRLRSCGGRGGRNRRLCRALGQQAPGAAAACPAVSDGAAVPAAQDARALLLPGRRPGAGTRFVQPRPAHARDRGGDAIRLARGARLLRLRLDGAGAGRIGGRRTGVSGRCRPLSRSRREP